MKRNKRLWILLAVCAAVFIGAFAVSRIREHVEAIRASGETVLSVSPETVTALSWKTEKGSFSFHREEKWIYDGDESFPVSEEAIQARLAPFENLAAAFIIDEPESLADYGLKNPECTVTLQTEDKTWEIRLGATSAIDEQRYFSVGDGKVYLASEDIREKYGEALSDLIAHDTVPALENVTRIRVSGKETFTVTRREDGLSYREADVYCGEKDGTETPMDTELVESFLSDIRYLSLEDYVTYNASDAELASCGLMSPAITAEITFSPEEGQTEVFTVSVSPDPAAKEAEETAYYARVGQSGILYRISSSYGLRLTETGFDKLRHQEVFPADFAGIDRLDITLDGIDAAISCLTEDGETETDPEGNRVFRFRGEEADTAALENALNALTAESFTSETPAGKEELRFTATLTSGQSVTLTLYRRDGKTCLAAIDGKPLALVSRSAAIDLVEAIYAIVL